jgi:magnesium chelatase family protein
MEVSPVSWTDLSRTGPAGDTTNQVCRRVKAARELQVRRFSQVEGVFSNSGMTGPMIREFCPLDRPSGELMRTAMERFGLSARAYDRVVKVARTIADLSGEASVTVAHVSEAIQYRALDRDYWS